MVPYYFCVAYLSRHPAARSARAHDCTIAAIAITARAQGRSRRNSGSSSLPYRSPPPSTELELVDTALHYSDVLTRIHKIQG